MLCWSGLSGFPQITLPLGQVDGAPFGISLLGPPGSDMALIRMGRRDTGGGEAGVTPMLDRRSTSAGISATSPSRSER